jgi:hypothetical protein
VVITQILKKYFVSNLEYTKFVQQSTTNGQ